MALLDIQFMNLLLVVCWIEIGVKILVYCTLSILAFWRKCCYLDSVLRVILCWRSHTLQYDEGWTLNCVEMLRSVTTWSVPALPFCILTCAVFVHLITLFEMEWGILSPIRTCRPCFKYTVWWVLQISYCLSPRFHQTDIKGLTVYMPPH